MALRHSFDPGDEATRIDNAVENVLADDLRTADLLGEEGVMPASTTEMGGAILDPFDDSL